MANNPPNGAEEIGKYLYLFRSPKGSNECLISAHGGYKKTTSAFDLPGEITLKFYGDHGNVLSDPGLELLTKKPVVVQEYPNTKDGKKVPNYILSKYQGKHSKSGETYGSIAKQLAYDAERLEAFGSQMDYVNNNPSLKQIYDSLVAVHVVTIRNRFGHADQNLENVISAVKAYDSSIKIFHCSFCRSLIGDSNPATSVVQNTNAVI